MWNGLENDLAMSHGVDVKPWLVRVLHSLRPHSFLARLHPSGRPQDHPQFLLSWSLKISSSFLCHLLFPPHLFPFSCVCVVSCCFSRPPRTKTRFLPFYFTTYKDSLCTSNKIWWHKKVLIRVNYQPVHAFWSLMPILRRLTGVQCNALIYNTI